MERKSEYPIGSPQEFAEGMYWNFSEFENLTTDEIKKCCSKTLKYMMSSQDCSSEMRLYYDMARKHIERRGV